MSRRPKLARAINRRKPAPKVKTFTDLVRLATRGLDDAVGQDGSRAAKEVSLYLRRLVAELKSVLTVSVRIFTPGSGPSILGYVPNSRRVPKIIKQLSGAKQTRYNGMTYWSRKTGGVREAIGVVNPDRSITVELGGYIFPFPGGASNFRKVSGNDYSLLLKPAGKKTVGKHPLKRKNPRNGKVETYERCHLWGHGFGDEARDGIMYGPAEFNQFWQNKNVEEYIRKLGEHARAMKGNLVLRAKATSYSPADIAAQTIKDGVQKGQKVRAGDGEFLLKEVTYELMIESPHKPGVFEPLHKLVFEIPPPW
ncbi:polymorphic toxin type 4 domain-containing protein, partial [Roseibium sp. RKSG952]|uniref:polymorphic toxin type 4 domain-containing protein n=1 Tax=Roseibium sp. RKSG952 TaxID=2529384 RepID=UPI0012BBDCD0